MSLRREHSNSPHHSQVPVEAERALLEREQQYRSIFESVNDAIAIFDLDRRVVDFNPAASRLFGYSRQEFLRLQSWEFIYPDSWNAFDGFFDAIRAGREVQSRGLMVRHDGSTFPAECRGAPFMYRGKPHALTITRDISEEVAATRLLEQRVEERTREIERLFGMEQRRAEQFRLMGEVGRRITAILSVDELLSQTVRLICERFGYFHVHIGLVEGDEIVFKPEAGILRDRQCSSCSKMRYRIGQDGVSGHVAKTGEPLLIPDIQYEPRYVPVDCPESGSAMALPLKVKGVVLGVLTFESTSTHAFDETDLAVMQSLSNLIAVAIENARLYERAQQLAALEERQKLARELHDSVSQALYGIALGARTARVYLERDPRQAIEPTEYVMSLAEAGMAEMRALIFELRPESLEKEGLVTALRKQAAALQARHQLQVESHLCDEPVLPIQTKQAVYRIAQEALHNAAKHACATHLELRLTQNEQGLCLQITDNGVGFDTAQSFPGHLGLHSMLERAAQIGGTVQVHSKPGNGTCVQLNIPPIVSHRTVPSTVA